MARFLEEFFMGFLLARLQWGEGKRWVCQQHTQLAAFFFFEMNLALLEEESSLSAIQGSRTSLAQCIVSGPSLCLGGRSSCGVVRLGSAACGPSISLLGTVYVSYLLVPAGYPVLSYSIIIYISY